MKILILVALKKEFKLKFDHYFKNFSYELVYTDIGLVNASMITTKYILEYEPHLIINYGFARNLKNHTGLKSIKEVYNIDKTNIPDNYHISKSYYNSEKNSDIIVGSSISFITEPDYWTKENCDLVDMELYGIAHVCSYFGIPWISRKWVSNNAVADSINDWDNILQEGQEIFLNFLTDTNIADLII